MSYECFQFQHLANPNSRILTILGSGVQARSHFQAMNLVQSFEEVSFQDGVRQ